jgi:hypothetical protein
VRGRRPARQAGSRRCRQDDCDGHEGARGRLNAEAGHQEPTLREAVLKNIERGSTVSTGELYSYSLLKYAGYIHGMVALGKIEYARGEFHAETRRKLQVSVQELDSLDPHSREPKVHG